MQLYRSSEVYLVSRECKRLKLGVGQGANRSESEQAAETFVPSVSALRLLEDVVFDRTVPVCPSPPNNLSLSRSCVMKLAEVVLHEFKVALEQELNNARVGTYDEPHPYDVFVSKTKN